MREMSFWDHIEEFRKMIMRIVWIFAISFLVTTYFVDQITELLLNPLRDSFKLSAAGGTIVYHSIFEKAWVQVDVSIMWAIIFSSPLWFYQIWKFIRPGLYDHEARAIKPFMVFAWVLFIGGMVSGYLALPYVINFLAKLGVEGVSANINLRDYVTNVSYCLLFLGTIFQFPNILMILGFMGIVTKQTLRKFRRYVYVGLAVFAAIFSPPDVISMLSIWLPLCFLYEIGVMAVAYIVHPYLYYVHMKKK
jgi:sec-independent protein translocase protein TatC